MKYQIKLKLAASAGFQETKTFDIEAPTKAEALVAAALQADDDGQKYWELESCEPMTS